jgi:hypothetical protein
MAGERHGNDMVCVNRPLVLTLVVHIINLLQMINTRNHHPCLGASRQQTLTVTHLYYQEAVPYNELSLVIIFMKHERCLGL